METIVRFEKINGRSILMFQCYDFEDDKSFKTRTILTEQRYDHYRFVQIGDTKTYKVISFVLVLITLGVSYLYLKSKKDKI
jgi:hypothetical protein